MAANLHGLSSQSLTQKSGYNQGATSSQSVGFPKKLRATAKRSQLRTYCAQAKGQAPKSQNGKLFEVPTGIKPKPSKKTEEVLSLKVEEEKQEGSEVGSSLASAAAAASSGQGGLVRTPLSGGVLSATGNHDLPSPALAVRNLMEQVRYAHLCTVMDRMHHRRSGYPFGSMVDYATDRNGFPIFSLSPLAIHTRNLMSNPRCSIVVQMPGWTGLSNARVTIFGDVYPCEGAEKIAAAREIFQSKHTTATHSHQWGNFEFFRMEEISDIYFVGGFGTVQWVDVKEYVETIPDKIVINSGDNCPETTLQKLNQMFSKDLLAASRQEGVELDDLQLVSIDKQGVDVRLRASNAFQHQIVRLVFKHNVESIDDAIAEMKLITNKGLIL